MLYEREPPHPSPMLVDGDCRPRGQIFRTLRQDHIDHTAKRWRLHSLDSNPNDRWTRCMAACEQRVEIRVERDHCSAVLQRSMQDVFILRSIHCDLACVNGVSPVLSKQGGGAVRQPFVEKQLHFGAVRTT